MKKYCILILCVLCIAVMPLCGCAEGKLELNDWISSRQIPTTYQAFLSEMPAFPTAELTPDGCMLRGLEAWGITPDNMVRWQLNPYTNDWVKDPDVQYDDAAEFLYSLESLEGEEAASITGMRFPIQNPCEMYDEIAISVTLEPISPEEGYPGQVYSVTMKKGSAALEILPNGAFTYSLDVFDIRNEYAFYANYSDSGDLIALTFFDDSNDKSRWFDVERGTDPMTGELFYTVTLFGGSGTDPDNLPFELMPDVRIVSPDPAANPDPVDPDMMNALNDLPRERAVWRNWPLKEVLPDALPEVTAEQAGDKTVYTVLNLRDWGIGSELGSTFKRGNTEDRSAGRKASPDPIPSDQVRIITPLEANDYRVSFKTDQEALSSITMDGWAVFDEETKELNRIRVAIQLVLKNGVRVIMDQDSRFEETGNILLFTTDDGWEITAYYSGDRLLVYTVRDYSDKDRLYDWTVRFDETDGESPGYYETVYFSSEKDSQLEYYKLNREEGQWYTESDDEGFVPEPCDPPAFLEHCPMLPIVD